MSNTKFKGIFTALITPFTNQKEIDFDALTKIIEHQIKCGITGLVVGGSTGESFALSAEEKDRLLYHAKTIINGRCLLIGNISAINIQGLDENIAIHNKHQVDAVMLAPMPYIKPTQQGIKALFQYAHKTINMPIILYNVPGRASVDISNQTIAELHENGIIHIVKEASGDVGRLTELAQNPNLTILTGEDANLIGFMANGGSGAISVLSNVAPKEVIECFELFAQEKSSEALREYIRYGNLIKLLFCESNPIPVKYLMSSIFNFENALRLPLTPLSETNKQLLFTEFTKLNIEN